jgi:hypothetical protein
MHLYGPPTQHSQLNLHEVVRFIYVAFPRHSQFSVLHTVCVRFQSNAYYAITMFSAGSNLQETVINLVTEKSYNASS